MGVTFGVYMLRNKIETWYEIYIKWFGASTAITAVIFGIMFNIFNDPDESGTCGVLAKCNE